MMREAEVLLPILLVVFDIAVIAFAITGRRGS